MLQDPEVGNHRVQNSAPIEFGNFYNDMVVNKAGNICDNCLCYDYPVIELCRSCKIKICQYCAKIKFHSDKCAVCKQPQCKKCYKECMRCSMDTCLACREEINLLALACSHCDKIYFDHQNTKKQNKIELLQKSYWNNVDKMTDMTVCFVNKLLQE